MNSKNILIGLFLVTTIAAGYWGWTQYQRAGALETKVATLTKNLKNAARDATRRPAARDAGDTATARTARDGAATTQTGTDARATQRAQWQNLRQTPKGSQLMAAQQRAMLDRRYAPLFKTLDLTPDQLDKFKDLLVDRQNAARDVLAVAREQGLDPRTDRAEIQQLVQQAQADVDKNIATTIGQDKLAQFQNYAQTAPQRAVVNQVAQSLSYTSEPLTPDQNDQLVALLAQNAPQDNAGVGQDSPITNDVITAAQNFLSPAQVDALRQQQAKQTNQQQLMQMWRQRRQQQ